MINEIEPDLHRIEVPLPDSPLKSVNSYVITSGSRNLVIDTGMLRPECSQVLRSGLDELGVDLTVTDFFITHIHADHMGLVSELVAPGCTLYFNRPEAGFIEAIRRDPRTIMDTLMRLAERGGFPRQEVEESLRKHPGFRYSPPEYPPFQIVEDGDRIDIGRYGFRVVATPGHTPGHLCLYEEERQLLVSGDHVLGNITPNITAWFEEIDSLGDYLQSLDLAAGLDVKLVLPGHREPFADCGGRIDELKQHHRHRLDEVLDSLRGGRRTAYEVASDLTWDIVADGWSTFPVVQKWFAVGEALSHLRYLERRDEVVADEHDGQLLYGLK
jgi:glyoxylase-like metal-dependent hydrolase (beta-lactamase superfamily II)